MKSNKTKTDRMLLLLYLFTPICLAIIVIIALHFSYAPKVARHRAENSLVQQQITKLSTNIIPEKKLNNDENSIKSMINAINTVDHARFTAVHLYKILTDLTPKNIYLLSLANKNDKITITGQTFAKEAVSIYLSRLAELTFITKPKLSEITTNKQTNLNGFKITFSLAKPKPFFKVKKEVK